MNYLNRPVNYVRLQRFNSFEPPDVNMGIDLSGSWMTYRLPRPMDWLELDCWLERFLPGWTLVSACEHNPDDEDGELDEPDVIGPCVDDWGMQT